MSLWSRIQSLFEPKRRADPLIRVTEAGFVLLDPITQATLRTVRWPDISRIQTYKLDLLTTDCICLVFEFRSGEPSLQVSEEWTGFRELFGPLSASFPSIPQNWYAEVMKPAFAANRTVLYEADGAHNTAAV